MARRSRLPAALLGALLAALSGCACDSVPTDAVEECSASQVAPRAVATDILFVIDDSVSMGDEQERLRAGLYAFIQTLDASPIADDFVVGVTNTSVRGFTDAATSYTRVPSVGVPYPQGTLVAVRRDGSGNPIPGAFDYQSGAFAGPRILDGGSASFRSDLEANVLVGELGSSREQPFAAARLALEKVAAGDANAGFLRPGARLAIVFLSDEDDCSGPTDASIAQSSDCRTQKGIAGSPLQPVSELASFLSGPLGGEVRDVVVAAIVGVDPGTLAPSCGLAHCSNTTCATAADKGDRFVELLTALGPQKTRLASICDDSFAAALADFASVIMSKTLPLDGAPADWRMLVTRLDRPGVGTIGCTIAPIDAPAQTVAEADAIYEPPRPGRPASLTFQNRCALEPGDRVDVNVVCVR